MTSKPVPIVIISHNTLWYTRRCIESIIAYTDLPYRLIVVDNRSTDGSLEYLEGLARAPKGSKGAIDLLSEGENLGWVKGVNKGLQVALQAYDPEYIVFGNSDIVMGDPLWLERLLGPLRLKHVGAVGPVSNAVMGLQHIEHQLPPLHEVKFLIGICIAMRADVLKEVGFLDERFGMGGNDDLDFSIRVREAGYRLMVNRLAFIYHYLSKTLLQVFGGWEGIKREDERTRALLEEKWGKVVVEDLWVTPQELMPSPYRERMNPAASKEAADRILEQFDDMCQVIGIEYRLVGGTCLGFYRDGGYIPSDEDLDIRTVGPSEKFKDLCDKLREHGFTTVETENKYQHFFRDNILLDVLRGGFAWGKEHDLVAYNGREYKVPHPVEAYLEDCYGKDWRIPKRKGE